MDDLMKAFDIFDEAAQTHGLMADCGSSEEADRARKSCDSARKNVLTLINARLSAQSVSAVQPVAWTTGNAPLGTKAPAINGGHWYRTQFGWQWNGPFGSGGTFPQPGGDWNGDLILPADADAVDAKRLDFMAVEGCQIETLALPSGTRYRVRWSDLGEAQAEWMRTPREAIDAAMAQSTEGAKG